MRDGSLTPWWPDRFMGKLSMLFAGAILVLIGIMFNAGVVLAGEPRLTGKTYTSTELLRPVGDIYPWGGHRRHRFDLGPRSHRFRHGRSFEFDGRRGARDGHHLRRHQRRESLGHILRYHGRDHRALRRHDFKHDKRRGSARHDRVRSNRHLNHGYACHWVSKLGKVDGRRAHIGGTMCYTAAGTAYIVPGSRYVISYFE